MPARAAGRVIELDSLRGLAALSVVAWHALLVWPGFFDDEPAPDLWLFKQTPLHLPWAGRQAVVFFFVLSGFVLAQPFLRGWVPILGFLIRRCLRIYVPYVVALLTAVALFVLVPHQPVPGLSVWFGSVWSVALTPDLLGRQLSLVASPNPGVFDPVLWSLVVEMRVSLAFPLLALAALRLPAGVALTLALAISYLDVERFSDPDALLTGHFVLMFVAGILLARYRDVLVRRMAPLPAPVRHAALAPAGLLYTFHYWFPGGHRVWLDDWATTAGVVLFMLAALTSPALARGLRHRALVAAGACSYSLYLYHGILIVAGVHLLQGRLPILLIDLLAVGLALPASYGLFLLVERPAIAAGRHLAARLSTPVGRPLPAPAPVEA